MPRNPRMKRIEFILTPAQYAALRAVYSGSLSTLFRDLGKEFVEKRDGEWPDDLLPIGTWKRKETDRDE